MLEQLLDWVFPPKCIICDRIIPLNEPKWFCGSCMEKLVYIAKPVCVKCGRAVETENTLCPQCVNRTYSFSRNISLFDYDGDMQHAIHRFKYGNHPEFGKGFGLLMANICLLEFDGQIDMIIPVPIHKKRERERGFNQATCLAKTVSDSTGVPMATHAIARQKDTLPQSKLSAKEREINLQGAFVINDRKMLKNGRILLIDDIFTTGSTVEACSHILRENGAKEIFALTLSTTKPFSVS